MSAESNVLLLSPFFYPEWISTGKYNTCLAQSLVKSGAKVDAVSSHPIFPAWEVSPSSDSLAGVRIFRGGAYVRYPASMFLRRAILELWFAWHVLSTCCLRRIHSDVVVPVFPPSLFFSLLSFFISRRVRKVGVIHDLQGVYAGQTRGYIASIVGRAIHAVERRCFLACDRLIFLSESMRDRAVADYGLEASRCVVCYPFVALEDSDEGRPEALASIFPSERRHVVYSGALGNKQKPDGLYAFMAALAAADSQVQCHIFSAGPHFERLHATYGAHGAVELHDLVSAECLQELYARSDVQVIPQELGTGDGSLPSKLPNLMAEGVPVFVICDDGSEVGRLVQSASAGYVANTWEPHALVAEFQAQKEVLLAEPRAARRARLREYVREHFSVERVVHEILRG